MAISVLLLIGLATAVFVGINIGGSSTGVSFGPAVGSRVLTMRRSSLLMSVFVLLGGFTVGTHVVDTLGSEFFPARFFTLRASIAVLLFTGLGMLIGNALRVAVSTSETAVGAVVGMGAAYGVLDWNLVLEVITWWLVSSVLAFWISAIIGRYLYRDIVKKIDIDQGNRGATTKLITIGIACYMGFSAGASNVANAIAPLVGSDIIGMGPGILLGGLAIGVGAFLLGPRTMQTVGHEITDLPIEAALLVELIAATIITGLSWLGIPASLAITMTMCVIGLGWGRASRHTSRIQNPEIAVINGGRETPDLLDLFNRATTKRIVTLWIVTPVFAGGMAYFVFEVGIMFGIL